jgi:hypothetical protein
MYGKLKVAAISGVKPASTPSSCRRRVNREPWPSAERRVDANRVHREQRYQDDPNHAERHLCCKAETEEEQHDGVQRDLRRRLKRITMGPAIAGAATGAEDDPDHAAADP